MKKYLAILLAAALAFSLAACGGSAVGGSSTRTAVQSNEVQFSTVAEGDTVAVLHTTEGDIWVRLFPQYAPMAVTNFTGLAQNGYYNNNIVTRVTKNFLWQAGDASGTGLSGQTVWGSLPFATEFTDKLHNYAGAVGMSQNNPGEGNLSQFYIVTALPGDVTDELVTGMKDAGYRDEVVKAYQAAGGAPYLDYTYTVFGQVFDGMDVADAIGNTKTDENSRPVAVITISSIETGTYPELSQEVVEARAKEEEKSK